MPTSILEFGEATLNFCAFKDNTRKKVIKKDILVLCKSIALRFNYIITMKQTKTLSFSLIYFLLSKG
jgi:hypothetical protein